MSRRTFVRFRLRRDGRLGSITSSSAAPPPRSATTAYPPITSDDNTSPRKRAIVGPVGKLGVVACGHNCDPAQSNRGQNVGRWCAIGAWLQAGS